ncbi:MAG: biotin synthase BioB [Pirellulaceae bacterium]|jgi:biotin synthase|nr:biotin synthase BioB [Pirellulaceae bacterium]
MVPSGSQDREADGGQLNRWQTLAEQALAGRRLAVEEGLAVLRSDDAEILDLLGAVYRVRRAVHGNRVHLNFLINAKSGRCGEDCGYCSQSRRSTAEIQKYAMLEEEEILAGARAAAERSAGTYCIVASGRGPIEAELARLEATVRHIKAQWRLSICVSPGLLTLEQARRLKAAGVGRVNHNLNTSQRYYPRICTTHTYEDRLDTLRAVRAAGMEICSGGIIGMGESDEDVVDLALRLGELEVEALPINFWLPIEGTPLAAADRPRSLDPRYCLKVLALFRLANPKGVLRMAAGRDVHLGCLQPLGLFAADSMFVGDYLTTKNQPPPADYRMIEQLGFEIVEER